MAEERDPHHTRSRGRWEANIETHKVLIYFELFNPIRRVVAVIGRCPAAGLGVVWTRKSVSGISVPVQLLNKVRCDSDSKVHTREVGKVDEIEDRSDPVVNRAVIWGWTVLSLRRRLV